MTPKTAAQDSKTQCIERTQGLKDSSIIAQFQRNDSKLNANASMTIIQRKGFKDSGIITQGLKHNNSMPKGITQRMTIVQ